MNWKLYLGLSLIAITTIFILLLYQPHSLFSGGSFGNGGIGR